MKRHAQQVDGRRCGECGRCVEVLRFHTLSVTGKPTLGRCEFVKERCVLLSERWVCGGSHFKGR